jgi:hypothetical protein
MKIDAPPPSATDTGELRRGGRSFLATSLIWFGVLVAVTLIIWVVLWSSSIKQAAPADAGAPASQRS